MRKFALIASLVLISATAQAGETRNLSLASGDEATTAQPARPVEAPTVMEAPSVTVKEAPRAEVTTPAAPVAPAETPKFVDRPSPVTTTAEAPNADVAKPAKPVADKTAKADKPKHRHNWSEARIIGELHRYGVYW